jgi:aspartyl-tRNA(Asn)/glutamyl-tRNA(Gln) amidotransferase subunit C
VAGLSRDDVVHVAHLARLGVTETELTLLSGQLNHILDQYAVLAELDTDHIAPTAQTIEVEGVMRDDVVTPSLSQDDVLAQAPEREGAYFRVPVVVGGADDSATE